MGAGSLHTPRPREDPVCIVRQLHQQVQSPPSVLLLALDPVHTMAFSPCSSPKVEAQSIKGKWGDYRKGKPRSYRETRPRDPQGLACLLRPTRQEWMKTLKGVGWRTCCRDNPKTSIYLFSFKQVCSILVHLHTRFCLN